MRYCTPEAHNDDTIEGGKNQIDQHDLADQCLLVGKKMPRLARAKE